jgi:hypothetical protein
MRFVSCLEDVKPHQSKAGPRTLNRSTAECSKEHDSLLILAMNFITVAHEPVIDTQCRRLSGGIVDKLDERSF